MMKTDMDFGQLVTAMVTPFNEAGDVDYNEAVRLANYLVDHGTDCLLVAGTTGECPTLTHDEEFGLFTEIKKGVGKRAKIMAGTGSNCTRTAIESTQEAERIGVDLSLQVVPYYNKPSQEGLYHHFKKIAENTGLPICLYNIPGRTGVNLEPDTVARLAKLDNIIAIKEAAGSEAQVEAIRKLTDPSFLIYSGDDALTLSFMQRGAVGAISVASHCAGIKIKEMMNACVNGDLAKARTIHDFLMPLFDVLFITSNPTPVKAALKMMGFNVGDPRLPLVGAESGQREKIKSVLSDLHLL
ncbi:MAG: 4-hydroxy-tetrahydrodipicolinate synthase [Candidatus Marinamargulisbacteria bacterium]|jgi:4-hydroxy-tetrahydrodipicolinate synthase